MECSNFISIAMTKSHLGEEKLYVAYIPRSQSTTEGNQGRNLKQKLWRTRLVAHSLAWSQARADLTFLCSSRSPLTPGRGNVTVGWVLLHQLIRKSLTCPHV